MSRSLAQDQELLRLTAGGDQRAYRQLFDAYYAIVARTAWHYVRDEALAFDVAQEVFAELWRRSADIAVDYSLAAYLRRMAVSHALNLLRTRRRFDFAETLPEHEGEATQITPLHEVAGQELTGAVQQLIDRLPEKCRVIWLLCREEGKSQREVAELLQISLKTVENQMTIALRKLREGLLQQGFLTFLLWLCKL
jgi:RNA polymerase sigma-70 factor, ECF subfamily